MIQKTIIPTEVEAVFRALPRDRTLQLQGQLLYTPKHIWLKSTLRGNIQLGITNYFQSQHEGIVHIETLHVDEHVSKNKSWGNVETVAWWWIHDLYSPIDGKLVKVNQKVSDDPYVLNDDPYQWIVEVQPDDPEVKAWMNQLLSFEEYLKLTIKLEGRPHSPINDLELNEIIEDVKCGA